jgi:hypothetical protein
VRFSPDEYESLRAQAAERHCTFSDLVRRVVLEHPLPPQRLPRVDAEVVRHLAKIGANVNQLSHNLNRWSDLSDEGKREFWMRGGVEMLALSQLIQELRVELLK